MKELINKISKNLKSKFYFDFDTSKIVWFRTGGKSSVYCIVYDQDELTQIIKNLENIPYKIVGSGSNILIRDKGYDGIIFKLGKKFNQISLNEKEIEVGAGILDVNLSKFAQTNNIKNFEFFSGIPGSVGGAIKMNAGCFGFETKDILNSIKTINSKGEISYLSIKDIKLQYRKSNIPDDHIILSANFNCKYGDKEEIKYLINKIKIQREKTQPLKSKTSGSTFKNPQNKFAAELIEKANCKGLKIGDAHVSTHHANFFINSGNATATQIEELGKKVIEKVYKKHNIRLEWEIKIIGNL